MLNTECFMHEKVLELGTGYYHIELSPGSKQLCNIVIPWGNYEFKKYLWGVCNRPDIFQEKISDIFKDINTLGLHIDNVLNTNKNNYKGHINSLLLYRPAFQNLQWLILDTHNCLPGLHKI